MLTNLEPNDVLFIDEIHRLSPVVEEILYPALEDFQIDIMIGEGPAARSVKLDLPPFTLVGATTRAGMLTNPLRDRFGIVARLEFYTAEELTRIVQRSAGLLEGRNRRRRRAARSRAASRGTPRVSNRLLRRVRDYAQVKAKGKITREVADAALKMLDVDPLGLDVMDRKLLLAVIEKFGGGPVGVDNLAAAIGEERDTIEDVLEPYPDPAGLSAAHAARPHGDGDRRTGISAWRSPTPRDARFGSRRKQDRGRAVTLLRRCTLMSQRETSESGHPLAAFAGRCASITRTPTPAGVVYYANYLKFIERARTEWLRALGFEQTELARAHKVVFVVRTLDDRIPAAGALQRLNSKRTVTLENARGSLLELAQTRAARRATRW